MLNEATLELIDGVRGGDEAALDRLCRRYLPRLRRWARGRLPGYARDLRDTEDLVQETLFHTVRRLDAFEHKGKGALDAYLRQAVMNRVRDEVRRVGRRGVAAELPPERADEGASPLQQAIGHEAYARYQQGLARLRPDERRAVVGRLEFGLTYAELCAALGKPSPDSARMTVTRAVRRLASTIRP